jgi:hypothetical protein
MKQLRFVDPERCGGIETSGYNIFVTLLADICSAVDLAPRERRHMRLGELIAIADEPREYDERSGIRSVDAALIDTLKQKIRIVDADNGLMDFTAVWRTLLTEMNVHSMDVTVVRAVLKGGAAAMKALNPCWEGRLISAGGEASSDEAVKVTGSGSYTMEKVKVVQGKKHLRIVGRESTFGFLSRTLYPAIQTEGPTSSNLISTSLIPNGDFFYVEVATLSPANHQGFDYFPGRETFLVGGAYFSVHACVYRPNGVPHLAVLVKRGKLLIRIDDDEKPEVMRWRSDYPARYMKYAVGFLMRRTAVRGTIGS